MTLLSRFSGLLWCMEKTHYQVILYEISYSFLLEVIITICILYIIQKAYFLQKKRTCANL